MTFPTMMFLAVGGVGVLLLALSPLGLGVLGSFHDLLFEARAAGMAGFGFATALALTLTSGYAGGEIVGASLIGTLTGVLSGWVAHRLAPDRRSLLLGMRAMVVTPIPADGYGEVQMARGGKLQKTLRGQPAKLDARADAPVAYGVWVHVVYAPSQTSVVVEPVPTPPHA